MNENERNRIYEQIHAMDVIMKSLNDEDILMAWLAEGVGDGTDTLEDIKEIYGDDDDLELEEAFKNLQFLFGKLVRWATDDGCCGWLC